jgi:hypothetical protein
LAKADWVESCKVCLLNQLLYDVKLLYMFTILRDVCEILL